MKTTDVRKKYVLVQKELDCHPDDVAMSPERVEYVSSSYYRHWESDDKDELVVDAIEHANWFKQYFPCAEVKVDGVSVSISIGDTEIQRWLVVTKEDFEAKVGEKLANISKLFMDTSGI